MTSKNPSSLSAEEAARRLIVDGLIRLIGALNEDCINVRADESVGGYQRKHNVENESANSLQFNLKTRQAVGLLYLQYRPTILIVSSFMSATAVLRDLPALYVDVIKLSLLSRIAAAKERVKATFH